MENTEIEEEILEEILPSSTVENTCTEGTGIQGKLRSNPKCFREFIIYNSHEWISLFYPHVLNFPQYPLCHFK